MQVKAILFDLAGTLTVPLAPMPAAEPWRCYAAATGPAQDTDEQVSRLLAAEHEAFLACREEYLSFTFKRILDLAGTPWTEEGVAAYRQAWEPYTYIPEKTVSVLADLVARGFVLGLLSNTVWPAEWHEETLARDGVRHLFTGAVFSSDLPVAKPHPDAFRALLAELGPFSPQDCLFVGDRMFEDIQGATSAGMHTALISAPGPEQIEVAAVPSLRIDDIGELPAIVRR